MNEKQLGIIRACIALAMVVEIENTDTSRKLQSIALGMVGADINKLSEYFSTEALADARLCLDGLRTPPLQEQLAALDSVQTALRNAGMTSRNSDNDTVQG